MDTISSNWFTYCDELLFPLYFYVNILMESQQKFWKSILILGNEGYKRQVDMF